MNNTQIHFYRFMNVDFIFSLQNNRLSFQFTFIDCHVDLLCTFAKSMGYYVYLQKKMILYV